tara:strand:- start:136 stop:351 length:216 start_codon:yes stop_codon:yes gene_type:complete
MHSQSLKNKIHDLNWEIENKRVIFGSNRGALTDEQVEKKKVLLEEMKIHLHHARSDEEIDRFGFKRVEQNA